MPVKEQAVGQTVKVYWTKEEDWFPGVIDEYHPKKGYHIQYFDGDDEWKTTLDNVEFEEQADFERTTKTTADDFDTLNYFQETEELKIIPNVKSPKSSKAASKGSKVPPAKEAKEISSELPATDDYQTHQRINREMIIEDLFKLSNRGVVLVGSVLSFQSFAASIEPSSLFFKVLFVEGGNQPAMFRCKTPIYTSTTATGNSDTWPSWKNARFRFDMIMPETENGVFKMQGEILIAVYSTRSNGGNDMLGQTSIELGNFSKLGTIENFSAGVEGRSITGAYPTLSRSNVEVGELHFQLNIAFLETNNNIKNSDDINVKENEKTRPISAGPISVSASRISKNAKGKSSVSSSKRPLSAVGTGGVIKSADGGIAKVIAPQRKIVSALSRKQREDSRRIERENKKMTSRLSAHGTRHTANMEAIYSGATSTPQPVTPAILSSLAEPKKHYSIVPCDDDKGVGAKQGDAKGERSAKDEPADPSLVKVYNDLKRNNTELENENANLKANLSKLTTHIKKYQVQLEKMKSRSGVLPLGSSGSGVAASIQGEKHFIPVVEEDLDIIDPEHKTIADEYKVLQSIRRGLVERIKEAKNKLSTSGNLHGAVIDRIEILKQRVAYLNNTTTSGSSESKVNESKEENSESTNDFITFERLRSINLEVMRTEDILKHNIHTMSLTSNIEELTATLDILKGQCNSIEGEIEKWKLEKVQKRDQLEQLMNTNEVLFRRQFLTQMSQTFLNLELNEKMSAYEESYKTIELEMLRLKLRAKERKQLNE